VKVSRWMHVAGIAAVITAVALAGSFGVAKAPAAQSAPFKTALVLDTGGPNDNGFNKNQVVGLNTATALIHGTSLELLSPSASQYSTNYTQAVNAGSNLIIAAGFLLESTVQTYAQANPSIKFAITDDPASAVGGYSNEMGITYKTEQGGCMVGVLAAKEAQSMGTKVIGVVGGYEIPPVDAYIAGYKFCAQKAVPGTSVVVKYSNDFGDPTVCSPLAKQEIDQNHAQVIFQVAGGCGNGALQYAGTHGAWGIGVDDDQYGQYPHILTSALKRTDRGVENAILAAYHHTWKGGKNFSLTLKNQGVGVGQIDSSVPFGWKSLMNQYRSQIIKGTLHVPNHCPNNSCA
jgi:basic membrane protein A